MTRSLAGRGLACLAMLGLLSQGASPARAEFGSDSCLGAFELPVRAGGTNGVHSIVAADLDADQNGYVDLVIASSGDDRIAWFEQGRDRADNPVFELITITTNADGASAVFVADLNGDGNLDVLSASANDNTIAWYRHNGQPDPKFEELEISTDALLAQAAFAADIDDDDDLDVLSASFNDNKIAWYENDGQDPPGFTEHVVTENAQGASSVYAADIDADGLMDVVSASILDDKISWWEQGPVDGDPPEITWTEHVITMTDAVFDPVWEGTRPVSVVVADLNGDCDAMSPTTPCLDVAAAFNGNGVDTGKITWFESNGGTTPTFAPAGDLKADLLDARQVFAQDMEGDDDIDLLAAYGVAATGDTITWFRNDGAVPPAFVEIPVSTAQGAQSVYAADIDGDGFLDVQSAASVPGVRIRDDEIAWYENDQAADPTFAKNVVSRNAASPESIVAEDMDDDGDLDVVSASSTDDTVAWHVNDGMGLQPTFTQKNIDRSADGVQFVFVADLDDSCDPNATPPAPCLDVISASPGDTTNGKIAWYQNDGATPEPGFTEQVIREGATERPPPALPGGGSPPIPLNGNPMSVFGADVNADCSSEELKPCVDVIAAVRVADEEASDRVVWYENDGAQPVPGFQTEHLISEALEGPRGVYAADVDRDGHLDVLVASTDDDRITWFRNLEGEENPPTTDPPQWKEIIVSSVADGAMYVTVADLDGDCADCVPDAKCYCLEVLSASSIDNKIAWYEVEAPAPPAEGVVAPGSGPAVLSPGPVISFDPTSLDFGDVFAGQVEDATLTLTVTNDGDETLIVTSIESTTDPFTASQVAMDPLEPGASHPITVTFQPTAVETFTGDLVFTGNADNSPASVPMEGSGLQFVENIVTLNRFFARFVSTGDVNGDGLLDILAAASGDGTISSYLQVAPPEGETDPELFFSELIITSNANNARAALAADLNGDCESAEPGIPCLDVVTAFFFEVAWHQGNIMESCNAFDADGDGRLAGAELGWIWTAFTQSSATPEAEWWGPVDFNKDGLIDGDDLAIGTSVGVYTRYVNPPEGEPEGTLCSFSCVSQE